jgi:GntR family transcriptional regulator
VADTDSDLRRPAWDDPDAIDQRSIVPAYIQLVFRLRSMITSLSLPVGAPLPSEPWLMNYYKVSRETVRRALAVLREIGLIETKRGLGHYVTLKCGRETVHVGTGDTISARSASPRERHDLYGGGIGFPVIVVAKAGQEPAVYDAMATTVVVD